MKKLFHSDIDEPGQRNEPKTSKGTWAGEVRENDTSPLWRLAGDKYDGQHVHRWTGRCMIGPDSN